MSIGITSWGVTAGLSLRGGVSARGEIEKSAVIKQEGEEWLLYTADGKRVLGRHKSAKDAYAQEYAIQKSQERQKSASEDPFAKYPEEMQQILGDAFGLGPKAKPYVPNYQDCPKCHEKKARVKEVHADTGMDDFELKCDACGEWSDIPQEKSAGHKKWIGFDLDGTLAKKQEPFSINTVGEPVPKMIKLLKQHLADGDTCKIMTARAYGGRKASVTTIHAWLKQHGLPELEVTCEKDPGMELLYDDRAVSVKADTGITKRAAVTSWGVCSGLVKEAAAVGLRKARNDTHTHPTPAQAHEGNYRKGEFQLHGMTIKIENPKGSTRTGYKDGKVAWSRVMHADYGYFKGTKAVDGDAIDCFIGPNLDSELVVAIDQYRGDKFDETKFVLGTDSQEEGEKLYLRHYPKGWTLGPASTCTIQQLKDWLRAGAHKKPFKKQTVKSAYHLLRQAIYCHD